FQAEDGIRDFHVTGVQTCALPILGLGAACGLAWRPHRSLTYFEKALLESPQLRIEYGDILGVTRERFTPSTQREWGARQIFSFEIGRASCRERVWIVVVGAGSER